MCLSVIERVNSDPVDLKSGVLSVPSLIPLALGVVERVGSVRVLVVPGLAALAVGEVGVGAAHSQVENEEELSVEGRRVVLANPRVREGRRELAALEEGLLGEVNLQNLGVVAIYVGVEAVLVPVESINVEILTK